MLAYFPSLLNFRFFVFFFPKFEEQLFILISFFPGAYWLNHQRLTTNKLDPELQTGEIHI